LNRICDNINSIDTTNCILVGDFNFRQINWDTNEASSNLARRFLDCVNENLLVQVVTDPTRNQNLIDLALVGDADMVESCEVRDPLGNSDHNTIWLKMRYPVPKINVAPYKVYMYSKGNYGDFNQDISDMDWDSIFLKKSVDDCWTIIKDTYQRLLDKYVPYKLVKPGKPHGQPWTRYKSVARAKKKRRRSWVKYKKSGLYSDEILFEEEKKLFSNTILRAKSDFEENLVQDLHSNPKRFWNYTRHFTRSSCTVNTLEKDGHKYVDDSSKADILNDFFVSVLTREEPLEHSLDIEDSHVQNSICDILITPDIVRGKLHKLKPNKACGPDMVHVNVLRNTLELSIPLTYIYNLSLRTGHVPQDWRDANITPLFKKGSRTSANNYRPISLTSQAVKILERIIQDSLIKHIDVNNIISCHQHGFQKSSSCVTQLIECLNDWTESYDQKIETDIIYLDFAKAFDSVPHQRLIQKIRSTGVRGNLLRWIQAWLTDRRQRVVLPGASSSWKPVYSGVPQGSILGPVLFLLYVNDIPQQVHSTVKMFADDTKLYRTVNSLDDCEKLQEDLNSLAAWANHWLLRFNEKKCTVLKIRQSIDYTFSLNGVTLQQDTEQKDLGITISQTLKPDLHIANIVKKANSRIGLIKRCFTNYTPKKIQILYTTMIRPLLEYGSTVWSPHLQKDILELDKVQRRCLRLTDNAITLPSLKDRREKQDICETYKYVNNLYKTDSSQLFSKSLTPTRGHSEKLEKHFSRTDIRKNFFVNRVVDTWNKQPQSIVSAPSMYALKRRLRSPPDGEGDTAEK